MQCTMLSVDDTRAGPLTLHRLVGLFVAVAMVAGLAAFGKLSVENQIASANAEAQAASLAQVRYLHWKSRRYN